MKIAAIQMKIEDDLSSNLEKAKALVLEAAQNGARLVVTQEALLSGYPPVELETVETIDFEAQTKAVNELVTMAREYDIFLAIGLIRKEGDNIFNSLLLVSAEGHWEYYDKRALWGWDAENFTAGTNSAGILNVDGIKIGFRICFEVRFPEYFRELYVAGADVIVISFCDQAPVADAERYGLIKSHLVTRAVENAASVISVNGVTQKQTAPTCFISPEGNTEAEALMHTECISYFEYQKTEPPFGRLGRIHYSDALSSI